MTEAEKIAAGDVEVWKAEVERYQAIFYAEHSPNKELTINDVVEFLKSHRFTHSDWASWFEQHPGDERQKYIGSAEFHREVEQRYTNMIAILSVPLAQTLPHRLALTLTDEIRAAFHGDDPAQKDRALCRAYDFMIAHTAGDVEPVAFIHRGKHESEVAIYTKRDQVLIDAGWDIIPLYAHPPAQAATDHCTDCPTPAACSVHEECLAPVSTAPAQAPMQKPRPYPHAVAGDGLKYQETFGFEGGSLTVKTIGYGDGDGSGWFCFAWIDCDAEENEDGELYWIVRTPNSELIALRDKLNEIFPAQAPTDAEEVANNEEAAKRYIRDWCPDHVKDYIAKLSLPLPKAEPSGDVAKMKVRALDLAKATRPDLFSEVERHRAASPYDVGRAQQLEVSRAQVILNRLAAMQEQRQEAVTAGEVWRPIESAPKDGTHFLACNAGRPYDQWWTFNQNPPIVVHYWDSPDPTEAGFYASFGAEGGNDTPLTMTDWTPLPSTPKAAGEDRD